MTIFLFIYTQNISIFTQLPRKQVHIYNTLSFAFYFNTFLNYTFTKAYLNASSISQIMALVLTLVVLYSCLYEHWPFLSQNRQTGDLDHLFCIDYHTLIVPKTESEFNIIWLFQLRLFLLLTLVLAPWLNCILLTINMKR